MADADVATKVDVRGVRSELRDTALRLEARIDAGKAEIINWLFGLIEFQTFVILGVVIALARVAGRSWLPA